MELTQSALTQICDDMNQWINLHGKIKPSTFIKEWHDLDNEFWIEVFFEAVKVHSTTTHELTSSVLRDINRLVEHVETCGHLHKNILNPDLGVKLPRAAIRIENWTVKTVLWRTIMSLREYYCAVRGIDLPNDDSSIGKLNPPSNPFEDMFKRL